MSTETARRAKRVERRAATPVAGAIAGILFALLFGVSVSMITTTMSGLGSDTREWLEFGAQDFNFAIGLLPFARVALHRLMFAAAAEAGAIVAVYAKDPSAFAASTTYVFARNMVAQIFQVYALRMAGVFLISNATIWLRTGIMPKWMALLTYALALVLLFVFTQVSWVILIFPGWVFAVSVYILATNLRRTPPHAAVEPGSDRP